MKDIHFWAANEAVAEVEELGFDCKDWTTAEEKLLMIKKQLNKTEEVKGNSSCNYCN
jgi:hypothetical protein